MLGCNFVQLFCGRKKKRIVTNFHVSFSVVPHELLLHFAAVFRYAVYLSN